MDDIDAGRHLEQFAAQVLEAADPGRGVVEKARLGLGQIDQLLDCMHRHIGIDGEHIGAGGQARDRDKVFDRIVGFLVDNGIDRVRDRYHHKRIAVGRGFRRDVGSDHAAGAGAIVDEHGLPELLPELIGDDAANDVITAARRKWNDQPDRPRRIVVGGGGCTPRHDYGKKADGADD